MESVMYCQVQDLEIYYETYGEGKPILAIHGYYIDHHVMEGCLEPIFKDRPGWKRIYIDLPGFGKTKPKDWIISSDVMLDIILQFIDKVIPGENFLLAGESYGGYLARGIVYKRQDAVDGLLLICPVILADKSKRELPPRTTLVKNHELLLSLTPLEREKFDPWATVHTDKVWKRFQEDIMPGVRLMDSKFADKLMKYGYPLSFDPDELVKPFTKPSLILTGRQDSNVGYKDDWGILMDYPRATFAVLDRAAHMLQIEQEGLFNALVNEWLDRVEEM
jgi:pimeloyl-ACP methyl ester carboxylesterase